MVFKNRRLKKRLLPPLTVAKTERLPMADLANRVL
jgi:hypothetical protein